MADKKLNPKHKRFADLYIKSWNATQAAIDAGYAPKSAAHTGEDILRRPEVAEYIEQRIKDQDSRIVADANETLAFLSNVMRGQIKDAFGLDASLSDRIGAAKELMKRHEFTMRQKRETGEEEDALSRALREEAEAMERERTGENASV